MLAHMGFLIYHDGWRGGGLIWEELGLLTNTLTIRNSSRPTTSRVHLVRDRNRDPLRSCDEKLKGLSVMPNTWTSTVTCATAAASIRTISIQEHRLDQEDSSGRVCGVDGGWLLREPGQGCR